TGKATSSPTTAEETTSSGGGSTTGCPAWVEGCPCGPEGMCGPELACRQGLCAAVEDTEEVRPACGDGIPQPGETCYAGVVFFGVGSEPIGVVMADLDRDGALDVVVSNASSDTV